MLGIHFPFNSIINLIVLILNNLYQCNKVYPMYLTRVKKNTNFLPAVRCNLLIQCVYGSFKFGLKRFKLKVNVYIPDTQGIF